MLFKFTVSILICLVNSDSEIELDKIISPDILVLRTFKIVAKAGNKIKQNNKYKKQNIKKTQKI